MTDPLDRAVGALRPISLEDLDERAALLRRVDVKHVIDFDSLLALLDALAADHDVLEIDGRRMFAYASVYFDTADLRSFREHAGGVEPRFKARTRRYVDTGACRFEVKVKAGGDTDKRQIEYDPGDAATVTPAAWELLDATLGGRGIEPPESIAATLTTEFDRLTLAARDVPARVTIDLGVRLGRLDGGAVSLRPELAIVETKSADGDSPADRALADLGAAQMSLSKYRVGIDMLDRAGPPDAVEELFVSAA